MSYWLDMFKLLLWVLLFLALAFGACFVVLALFGSLAVHLAPRASLVVKICVLSLSLVCAPFVLVGAFIYSSRKHD